MGGGGGPEPWRDKAEKFAEEFAEKFAGNFPEIRQTKLKSQPNPLCRTSRSKNHQRFQPDHQRSPLKDRGFQSWIVRTCTSTMTEQVSESVKCRFSKCRFSVLNIKFDFISDGGCTREKQIQKALGSLPPCRNRCRFSESAICSSRVYPPSEIKSNFKFKTLRWRPLRWRLTLSEGGALPPQNGFQKLFPQTALHFEIAGCQREEAQAGQKMIWKGSTDNLTRRFVFALVLTSGRQRKRISDKQKHPETSQRSPDFHKIVYP